MDYAVWFLCVCSLGNVLPVDSSHFMGGIIRWRPVNPAAFDGTVQITHRIAWRRDSGAGGGCTQATIDAQTLLSSSHNLTCQSGCNGTIGNFSYYCTDFSVTDNWSAGERTYTYNLVELSFEAAFSEGDWISVVIGGGRWELRVRGNLTYREDTGLVNSSPVVNIPPLIRIQHGCNSTIKIPVEDADGDHVRCRWAESSLNECGEVCRAFPASLDETACELEYQATGQAGRYAVALQIEDFATPNDTIPLSSIPIQFVVHVFTPTSSDQQCSTQVDTTQLSFCVSSGSPWGMAITERLPIAADSRSILDIVTASPLGMRKSELVPSSNNPGREWMTTVTWIPLPHQLGPNIFCYSVLDNTGISSAQNCITLLNRVMPPKLVPGSVSPTGEIISNHSTWSLRMNRQFTRPLQDRFIRIFNEGGEEIISINAATSSNVIYPSNNTLGRTLIFRTDYYFPENQKFYILLDQGIVTGTDFCNAESPALKDPTVWTFMIVDVTPPKVQLKTPVMSNEGLSISWNFSENASAICELHSPSMLNITTIPCLENTVTVLLSHSLEGYSLSIQATDIEGNVAEPVQLTWSIATITCGNIKLTDIEVKLHTSDNFIISSLIYHCAESVSVNQTITSVCSSGGDSLWNPDPASHGCAGISSTGAVEKKDIIIIVSTVLAFIVGIFCGLLSYHCIRWLLTRRASTTGQLQETQLARMPNKNVAETDAYKPYEDVNTAATASYKAPHPTPNLNTHMELIENVAYAQYY